VVDFDSNVSTMALEAASGTPLSYLLPITEDLP
jgi:hypothetical protein